MPPCISTNTGAAWFIPPCMKISPAREAFRQKEACVPPMAHEACTAQARTAVRARAAPLHWRRPSFRGKARSDSAGYLCLLFIARSTSRFPSRSLMVSRLSCSAFPLASAISHFTRPFFQCRFSGTSV